MRGWIYTHRQDIIAICHTETRAAIAYRRRLATQRKTKEARCRRESPRLRAFSDKTLLRGR